MGKIAVIGAGPAGSYSAKVLSEQGHDVTIFEDHFVCGNPIQCTGILTHVGHELIPFDKKFIDNKIEKAILFARNGRFVEVKFRKPNIIVNRTKYDQFLLDQALDSGAKLKLGSRYIGCAHRKGRVSKIVIKDAKTKKKKEYKVDFLVGADGPNSGVAKSTGLFENREFFIGAQATVKIKNQNQILFYPYIKDLAWAVPENKNTMRIGIAARHKASQALKDFLKRFNGKVTAYQGGPIPIYNPSVKTQKENVFLVGDAATQVKPTTAGGIIQAMTAAFSLGKAFEKNPKKPNYEREWRKAIGKDLYAHHLIRKMLDNFNDNDWNRLIEQYSKDPLNKILVEEDRDHGAKIGLKCLMKKPSMVLYARKLLY